MAPADDSAPGGAEDPQRLAKLEKEVKVLQAAARESLRREVGMRRELQTIQEQAQKLQVAVDDANEQLQAREVELEATQQELQHTAAQSNKEIEELQTRLDESLGSMSAMELEVTKLRSNLQEAENTKPKKAASPKRRADEEDEEEDPLFAEAGGSPALELKRLRARLKEIELELEDTREALLISKEETAEAERVAEQERENAWNQNEDLRREVLIKEELKAMQAHTLALEQDLHEAQMNQEFTQGVVQDLRQKLVTQEDLATTQLELERERIGAVTALIEKKLAGVASVEQVEELKTSVNDAALASMKSTQTRELTELKTSLDRLREQQKVFTEGERELLEMREALNAKDQELLELRDEVAHLRSQVFDDNEAGSEEIAVLEDKLRAAEEIIEGLMASDTGAGGLASIGEDEGVEESGSDQNVCPVHNNLEWKARQIFDKFDNDGDGLLREEELMSLMRSVNPHMTFTTEHLRTIVDEVLSQYPDVKGLPFEGLLNTYLTDESEGNNIDHDLHVLEIPLEDTCVCSKPRTADVQRSPLEETLLKIKKESVLVAPDLTPKLQMALDTWRAERAQLLQAGGGDAHAEADQLRQDMERQQQQLAEALVRRAEMEQELERMDPAGVRMGTEIKALEKQCLEYKARIQELETLQSSTAASGSEASGDQATALKVRVAELEGQLAVTQERLQDLEASKALPEIWAELRKKDARVVELEAKLQLTGEVGHGPPGAQAQNALDGEGSGVLGSSFKEAATQVKLRDLEAQLREKDQQIKQLEASVSELDTLQEAVRRLEAESADARGEDGHGSGQEVITAMQVEITALEGANKALAARGADLERRLARSGNAAAAAATETASTQTPSSFHITDLEVPADQLAQAAARVEVPMPFERAGASMASTLASTIREDDLRSVGELAKRVAEREEQLAAQQAHLRQAETEMDELISLLTRSETRLQYVESNINNKVSEVDDLRRALDQAQRQGAEADEKAAEANAAGTLAVATADLMQDKIKEMERKVSEAKSELNSSLKELETERERAYAETRVANALKASLEELQEKLFGQERLVHNKSLQLSQTEEQVSKLRSAISAVTSTTALKANPHDADFKRRVLLAGGHFVKHGSDGRARDRHLWLADDLQSLAWARTKRDGPVAQGKGGWSLIGGGKVSSVSLKDVRKVLVGKTTSTTMRIKGVGESQLFSLECRDRTLDFQVPPKGNGLTRDQWTALFTWLLEDRNGGGLAQELQITTVDNPTYDLENEPAPSESGADSPRRITAGDGGDYNDASDMETSRKAQI